MPTVKLEDTLAMVIADERVQQHLKAAAAKRSRIGFRDYVSQFGIHDFGELTEGQMFAFVAAKNIAPVVDVLQIPRGKDSSSSEAYASYDLHRQKTSLGPSLQSYLDSAPTKEQEWEVLRDPEDIPEAIPEDLLLRRLAPMEFLRRLTEGELLRSAWVQEDLDELVLEQLETEDTAVLLEETSATEDARPFGYLLLDSSESMGTARDRRSDVARGIALAYLQSQFEAGNPTYLYLFTHELSPMYGGEGRAAFESAVRAVLSHAHEGMTNLQGALKLLSSVLTTPHARTDIALITDGVTRLSAKPFENAHLHTFLIGLRPEEFDQFGAEQYQESLLKLRTWSDFLFRITPDTMAGAAVPSRPDVIDAGKMLYGIADELRGSASTKKIRRVQMRIRNLVALISAYRNVNGTEDESIERLWREGSEALREYGRSDAFDVALQNANQWSPLDRDMMLSLETREQRSLLDGPSQAADWVLGREARQFVDPFSTFRLIWRMIKGAIKELGRRLHSKKR